MKDCKKQELRNRIREIFLVRLDGALASDPSSYKTKSKQCLDLFNLLETRLIAQVNETTTQGEK
jgi:hypothetical protein